jgi:DNA-directed RNA polymerase specialized sigma24 family protein
MDLDEFHKWLVDHEPDLRRVAMAVVGPRYAEDAVQDAVRRALETRNYERCGTNMLTWMTTGVRSAASSARRAEKRTREMQRCERVIQEAARDGKYRDRRTPVPIYDREDQEGPKSRTQAVRLPEAEADALPAPVTITRFDPVTGEPTGTTVANSPAVHRGPAARRLARRVPAAA